MDALTVFFDDLWRQYTAITPQAQAIRRLFEGEGESPVNDHVAFRTFADSNISIAVLEPQILALGYEHLADYQFPTKKLFARCYLHEDFPTKIFISELLWPQLADSSQRIIKNIISQLDVNNNPQLNSARLWSLPSFSDYQTLLAESEYAAWLSVWGLRANHFTIFVNFLKHFQSLAQVVKMVGDNGYSLNTLGGVIKGTEQDLLIQAATMADKMPVVFTDVGQQQISSCYYEFAQRFTQADGNLYQGFVPSSADKIFESTSMATQGGKPDD